MILLHLKRVIKKWIFSTVLCILFCQNFYAQIEKEEIPLIQVLQQLEQEYECSFSYADQNIKNVNIIFPLEKKTLEEIIETLQKITHFKFTILTDNLIVISLKNDFFSICGYILDLYTNEPIPNVSIQSGSKSTSTDSEGFFELRDLSNNDLVSIRHLAYKSVQYISSNFLKTDCDQYFLVPKIEQINEIIIRKYLTKGIRKTIYGSYNIDYNDFGILPGLIEKDVLQTIQTLPGVLSVDERISNINIRGGTHHENLLLWDGIKMYQSGHFFGLISAFNPHVTKKVLLVKNGTPANYSDGVSGMISMHTDDVLNHKLKTGVGLNLINADIFMDVPIGNRSSIQLAARKSINDFLRTPTFKKYFDKSFQNTEVIENSENVTNINDEFSFHDVNVRWLYHLSDIDKVRVNLVVFNNDLSYTESSRINSIEESKESSASQNNQAASVYYSRKWNADFSTELQLYTTEYLLKSTNFDILNNQRLIQENEVIEETIKLDSKYRLSDELTMYNGYQYIETGAQNIQDIDIPLFKSTIKDVIRSHGLSSQLGYQSRSSMTNIRTGIRLNYLEKFGVFFVEPRLSFSQHFLNGFNVEVLGEFKHQTSSQIIDFQNDFLGVENRRWVLANNDDIPIIKSKQISAGLHYNKDDWLISAEGYYKKVNGITSQSQGFQNQFQFIKTDGSYSVYGVDFLINKHFKNLSAWVSYSYMDNQYSFPELQNEKFSSNIDITHSLSLAASYSVENFQISGGLNWHTGKPITKPIDGNELNNNNRDINYGSANSSRLEDYLRVDVSAQYNFKIKKGLDAYAGISIWNVLNK